MARRLPPAHERPTWLSTMQVALLLGITYISVSQRCRRGSIRAWKNSLDNYCISMSEVERLLGDRPLTEYEWELVGTVMVRR